MGEKGNGTADCWANDKLPGSRYKSFIPVELMNVSRKNGRKLVLY